MKDLNFERCRTWLLDAESRRHSDRVYCFIAPWIAFNHYYGAFASANRAAFSTWSNANMNGSEGDKAQWVFLISGGDFTNFFDAFRAAHTRLLDTDIDLPVKNPLNGKEMPAGIADTIKLKDLSSRDLFDVVYQIRNNLFHGNKDPFTVRRDEALAKIVSEFTLIFASALVSDTAGEVLNIYNKAQKEQIEKVKVIAASD